MIQVTFVKSNYGSQKNSQASLREAIRMMNGEIQSEGLKTITAVFPLKWISEKNILDNANFWANIR